MSTPPKLPPKAPPKPPHIPRIKQIPRIRRKECGSPRKSCCRELLHALRNVPGFDVKSIHKPKKTPRQRLTCLCNWLPTQDAITPILFHTLERFLVGKNPESDFEKHIFTFLKKLGQEHADKLEHLKSAHEKFKSLNRQELECVFEKSFLNWAIDQPVDQENAEIAVGREIAAFGRLYGRRDISPCLPAGLARPWSTTTGLLVEGGEEFPTVNLPFPYICKVNEIHTPAARFRSSGFLKFEDWELEQECNPVMDPYTAEVSPNCQVRVLADGCDGGTEYSLLPEMPQHSACIRVPTSRAGLDVELTGFNFFSPSCKVRLQKEDQPDFSFLLDVTVCGDSQTPLQELQGTQLQYIADCRVHDKIRFTLPVLGPDSTPLAPGLYRVDVIVPNDGSSLDGEIYSDPIHGITPPELATYQISTARTLLKILPSADLKYRLWLDKGHCYDETDWEAGSDEIWVQPMPVRLRFDEYGALLPLESGDEQEILSWGDVDKGEDHYYGRDLIGKSTGTSVAGTLTGICMIGFEVDDEDAAKARLKSYSEAWGLYWKEAWPFLIGSAGALATAKTLATLSAATTLYGALAIVAVFVIASFIWAGWAPPDLIMVDILVLDEEKLYNLTDSSTPLPLPDSGEFSGVQVNVLPLNKWPNRYTEERRSRSSGEGSNYGFVYVYERLP